MITIRKLYILISILFLTASNSIVHGAELKNTWINIEDGKTKVVIQFDIPVTYRIQYTPESRLLSLYFLKANLGSVNKTMNINNEMIETINLQNIPENMVKVDITLKANTYFSIVPLKLLSHIGIEVVKGEIYETAENIKAVETPKLSPEQKNVDIPEANTKEDKNRLGILAKVLPGSVSINNGIIENYYYLIQILISMLLIAGLILMIFKIKVLFMGSKNSQDYLKEDTFSADIITDKNRKGEKQSKGKYPGLNILNNPRKNTASKIKINSKNSYQDKYKKIHKLAQQGMDRFEISKRSDIPIGEVNLILDLSRIKSKRSN